MSSRTGKRKTKVLAVLNQKGGSGKTTIAINLAHAFQRLGNDVLIVDTDPQGTARDWSDSSEKGICPVVGLDRESLARDLPTVAQPYDWVVIDGPPQLTRISAAAVRVADVVLIPVQPSPYDIWSCADLVDILDARRTVTDGLPHAAFVVSRAITNTRLSNQISDALEAYGIPVLKSRTTQRVAYPTTAASGQTVFTDPSSLASQEIEAIREEVEAMLNDTSS